MALDAVWKDKKPYCPDCKVPALKRIYEQGRSTYIYSSGIENTDKGERFWYRTICPECGEYVVHRKTLGFEIPPEAEWMEGDTDTDET